MWKKHKIALWLEVELFNSKLLVKNAKASFKNSSVFARKY